MEFYIYYICYIIYQSSILFNYLLHLIRCHIEYSITTDQYPGIAFILIFPNFSEFSLAVAINWAYRS